MNSQDFESYIPVYDAIPESWEEAKPFIVEQFKAISNAVNIREIGWLLDEELLSGKQLYPGTSSPDDQQFRSVLRKVVNFGPVTVGLNQRPHGIVYDGNFTLIDLWISATNVSFSNTFSGAEVSIDPTNINFISPSNYDRCNAFVEYVQEL